MVMMNIVANLMHFKDLNDQVKATEDKEVVIDHCIGQRYIGSGLSGKKITINGTAGNALGAYLNGADIVVNGNAQDATGDTMNDGTIVIYGSSGDATGYAMRGGKIFIKGDAGYRAGIHMKAYQDKLPVLVIGGTAGSFLGEYQAGGVIIVLGLGHDSDKPPVGYFCGTGMHGGKIVIRSKTPPSKLPPQVCVNKATQEDMNEIENYLEMYCQYFGMDKSQLLNETFFILTPNTQNPYRQLYTHN